MTRVASTSSVATGDSVPASNPDKPVAAPPGIAAPASSIQGHGKQDAVPFGTKVWSYVGYAWKGLYKGITTLFYYCCCQWAYSSDETTTPTSKVVSDRLQLKAFIVSSLALTNEEKVELFEALPLDLRNEIIQEMNKGLGKAADCKDEIPPVDFFRMLPYVCGLIHGRNELKLLDSIFSKETDLSDPQKNLELFQRLPMDIQNVLAAEMMSGPKETAIDRLTKNYKVTVTKSALSEGLTELRDKVKKQENEALERLKPVVAPQASVVEGEEDEEEEVASASSSSSAASSSSSAPSSSSSSSRSSHSRTIHASSSSSHGSARRRSVTAGTISDDD